MPTETDLSVRTGAGECLGNFRVDRSGPGWIGGALVPTQEYLRYRSLFLEWTVAMNGVLLSRVDQLEAQIRKLELSVQRNSEPLSVREIQVYDEANDLVAICLLDPTPGERACVASEF